MAKSVTGGFNSRKLCHLGVLYDQNIQNAPLQWICVVQFCTFTSMTFSMQFVLLAAEITGGWSFSTASTAQFVILNAVESTGTIAGVPQHCMCASLDPMCLPIAQGACMGTGPCTQTMPVHHSSVIAEKVVNGCCAGAGTVFVLTWPLYPAGMVEAIVASSVIWAATARFVLVGLKIFPDPQFASSMGAPHGQEHKLLQGPVQYGTVIALLTTFCFKSPSSVIPIGVLCGGDAIAALVGRRFGKQCLPWNNNKVRLHCELLLTQ